MYGYDAQLEMGGLARGSFEGLNPRHLLYPEAFAHTNFQDMSGAAFLGVRGTLVVTPNLLVLFA